jgi:Ca2+-binding RTX toxin-like protein
MAVLLKTTALDVDAMLDQSFGLYIEGTDFNDILNGSAGGDEIHGRAGSDVIYGFDGDDSLFGEADNDQLFGGNGNDLLDGGAGNDTLIGGAGADALNGGSGFDTASYVSSSTAVYVNLANNWGVYGDAQGDTFNGIEKVIGSSFGDALVAGNNGGALDGGAGDDFLWGGAGLDVLIGGAGSDTLEGGLGLDVLTGGSGADVFKFNFGDGPDLVTDFQSGVDKIMLGEGFGGRFGPFGINGELATGTQAPTVGLRGNQLFYDTDDHQLYELHGGWNPRGPVEAVLLATFSNDVQLHTSDFLL